MRGQLRLDVFYGLLFQRRYVVLLAGSYKCAIMIAKGMNLVRQAVHRLWRTARHPERAIVLRTKLLLRLERCEVVLLKVCPKYECSPSGMLVNEKVHDEDHR